MLEHADRDDRVERPLDVAVVLEEEARPVGQAAVLGAPVGDGVLLPDSVTPVTSTPQRSAR
jgi:hypothetical protein